MSCGSDSFGMFIELEAARTVVHKAIDCGINLFDTADFYGKRGGSETILGQILGERRKDIILATKCGLAMDDAETLKGASRRYILSAVEASLKRLNTSTGSICIKFIFPIRSRRWRKHFALLTISFIKGKCVTSAFQIIPRGKWRMPIGYRGISDCTHSFRARTNTACWLAGRRRS